MSNTKTPPLDIESLWVKARPDQNGLLPCVVQEVRTRRVLMVAWASRAALAQTLETGQATFWSRSRREIWEKGATSGNRQKLVHVRLDCDGDTLMYLVEASGPACHEGYRSCFSWRRVGNGWSRDPDDSDHGDPNAETVQPGMGDDLLQVAGELARQQEEAAPIAKPSPRALRPEKAIRIGAAVESRARGLANALQLKQKEKARDAAVLLMSEVLRALATAGMTSDDLRGALTPTEKSRPADVRGPASGVSVVPEKDEYG